jgi:hypothetical protein
MDKDNSQGVGQNRSKSNIFEKFSFLKGHINKDKNFENHNRGDVEGFHRKASFDFGINDTESSRRKEAYSTEEWKNFPIV